MKVLLVFLILPAISFCLLPDGCAGSCKYLEDCMSAMNDIKMHAKAPTEYCDTERGIVCCKAKTFSRISERSKSILKGFPVKVSNFQSVWSTWTLFSSKIQERKVHYGEFQFAALTLHFHLIIG